MRRTLALLLLLLGAGPALAGSDLAALLDKVGGADLEARYPAFAELQKRRDPALVPLLLDRVVGWDLSAQSYGASLLDGLAGESAAAAWKKLLTAASPFLRGCAALRSHGADPVKSSRVLSEAIEAARADPGTLTMLLGRLGGFQDAGVQKTVRGLLAPGASPVVLGAALSHLAYARDREAPPLVRLLAKDALPVVRALAAAWLLRIGEEELAGALSDALAAGELPYSDFLRAKPWLVEADHLPEPVLAAVLLRVEKEEGNGYVASLIDLLAHAQHQPAVPALRRLLDGGDAVVARAAFEALAALGALDGQSLAGQLAASDPERRLAAADALRKADDVSGLEVVLALARAGSPQRREAVRVLGGFRLPAAVEPLIDALTDDDLTTRANAYNGLSSLLLMLFPYRRLDLTTTGYATNADAAARSAGAARLRAWWQAHRDERW